MKIDDLIPLIIVVLIIFVSLVRVLLRAAAAAKKGESGRARPSMWGEFKKALQEMAEQQRKAAGGEVEPHREEGEEVAPSAEEPAAEEPLVPREEIVIVRPMRPRRRMGEPVRVRPQPEAAPAATPHRPEDLGSGISREVADIVHRPIEERMRKPGLAAQTAAALPSSAGVLQLVHASSEDLRKAILLQEIISSPLAERMPGPLWLGR